MKTKLRISYLTVAVLACIFGVVAFLKLSLPTQSGAKDVPDTASKGMPQGSPSSTGLPQDSRQDSSSLVPAQTPNAPIEGLPANLLSWLRSTLSAKTFAEGISFLEDRDLPEQARLLVLDKLHSWRRRLAPEDLKLLFAETERIAGDAAESTFLRARAVSAMATILIVMQEQDIITRADVETYFPFLTQLGQDETEIAAVRGSAIRALGTLRADDAGAMLRAVLSAPENSDKPELTAVQL